MAGFKVKVKPTKSEEEGMDHVLRVLAEGARSIEQGFKEPDDDWAPIWLIINPDGVGTFYLSELDKELTAELMGKQARAMGAHVVGFIGSSWGVDAKDVPEDERKRFRELVQAGTPVAEMPYRVEQVVISIYAASQVRLYNAVITRYEDQPPHLGEFYRLDDPEMEVEGRLVNPVQAGLRQLG